MLKFAVKRILVSIPTLLAIISLVFFLVHITPGNPFDGERALSPEALKSLMAQYRLDLPLWQQYLLYLDDLIHGSFGISMKYLGQPINSLLFPDNMGGFWVTLRLSIYTMLIAVPFGIILGAYAGLHKNSWFDKLVVSSNIFFTAVPTMVTGPLFVLILAVTLQLFPAGGWGDGDFAHLFLPVLVLVLAYSPTIAFVTRGSIIDVLNSNYIRTARAKGLPTKKILFKHAIKPAILPVISLLGPMFAGILVGAVVTEQIFTLPGLGVLTTNAATNRDYNMIMAITILGSILTIVFNIIVDLLYMLLDPKIKQ
ncbi:MAG: ABC transporter permease subunit [Burkholderiales bacterium]|jgi:oligopeptide transport system permease protein|nr:ABC transporter permease subunit [Burkholderiales bacterium]MBP9768230.1 ABC transporter permease subunit [Burkholderiales bacterium]